MVRLGEPPPLSQVGCAAGNAGGGGPGFKPGARLLLVLPFGNPGKRKVLPAGFEPAAVSKTGIQAVNHSAMEADNRIASKARVATERRAEVIDL